MMLKRSDVKAIVDILLGTETADEDFQLDELSVSVVCEVMNQMMGAASTALSDLLGRMVNISTPESFELDDLDKVRREHFPVETGPVVVVSFKLSIEGVVESEFMNVMSVELVRELVSGFGLDMDELNGTAAPAPEPAPAPAPASSGGTLSQEEIERLMAGGVPAEPAPAPAPASSGGTLSQEEIERLMAGGVPSEPAPAPAAAPQPAAPAQPQTPPPAAGGQPYPQMPGGYPPYPPQGQGGYPPYPMYPPYYMYPPQQQPEPAKPPEPKVINAQPPRMQPLDPEAALPEEQKQNLDLIMNVSLEVAVEIGRTRRKIQDIIAFSKGSLVVLDKLAGDQVDLLVNGQCIARGDVVVIDDNFGIRITEILQKPDINELAKT